MEQENIENTQETGKMEEENSQEVEKKVEVGEFPEYQHSFIKYNTLGGEELPVDKESEELNFFSSRIGKIENLDGCGQCKVGFDLIFKIICLRKNLIKKIEGLDDLVECEELELYDNKIKVIENVGHLKKLKTFDVSFNNVKKIQGLEELDKLEKMFFVSNRIKKIENLENKPLLNNLELSSNKISKIENLVDFPCLEEIYMNKNRIELIENLENISHIKVLGLSCNRIKKIEGLDTMINLEQLYLAENYIEKIENLDNNPNLKLIDLSFNKISLVENLSHLEKLEDLWMSNNQLQNFSEFEHIAEIPNLKVVYFELNPIAKNPGYRQRILEIAQNIQQIDHYRKNFPYRIKV